MKAFWIIKEIDHNDLTEQEADILVKAVEKIKKIRSDQFDKSLKSASRIVASWPKWKRELADQCLRPTRNP